MLGLVLGWKFDNYPGITTREEVLVGWPEALGSRPTTSQVTTWTQEYTAGIEEKERIRVANTARTAELLALPSGSWTPAQVEEMLRLKCEEPVR
jgi:hypothetical protein